MTYLGDMVFTEGKTPPVVPLLKEEEEALASVHEKSGLMPMLTGLVAIGAIVAVILKS